MQTFSASLAFYITGWIRLTKPSNAEILVFGTTEQTIEQRVGCRWFYTPWRSCEATVMEIPVVSRFINSAIYYNDVIMRAMPSLITSLTIVCSTVCSGADQRKHQSSASLAFVLGIHWRPVNSPHDGPFTRKMFPFDDVMPRIMHVIHILLCFAVVWQQSVLLVSFMVNHMTVPMPMNQPWRIWANV